LPDPQWRLREPSSLAVIPPRDATMENSMPLVNLILVLIVVGVVLWLINTYVPMDPKIKSILNAVVVIGVVLWLLQVFGLISTLTNIRVGH
jgi:hypothetical protein